MVTAKKLDKAARDRDKRHSETKRIAPKYRHRTIPTTSDKRKAGMERIIAYAEILANNLPAQRESIEVCTKTRACQHWVFDWLLVMRLGEQKAEPTDDELRQTMKPLYMADGSLRPDPPGKRTRWTNVPYEVFLRRWLNQQDELRRELWELVRLHLPDDALQCQFLPEYSRWNYEWLANVKVSRTVKELRGISIRAVALVGRKPLTPNQRWLYAAICGKPMTEADLMDKWNEERKLGGGNAMSDGSSIRAWIARMRDGGWPIENSVEAGYHVPGITPALV